MNLNGKRVVIAKTNDISDVVHSLPMAALIKKEYPRARVIFLASKQACTLARLHPSVDEVHDFSEVLHADQPELKIKALKADVFIHATSCKKMAVTVRKAGVPVRVGSAFQWYHWMNCNRFANITRQHNRNRGRSDLGWLRPLGLKADDENDVSNALSTIKHWPLKKSFRTLLNNETFTLILHAKRVGGTGNRWTLEKFDELIKQLQAKKFNVFFNASEEDKTYWQPLLNANPQVINLIGRMNSADYFMFLKYADGMVSDDQASVRMADAQHIRSIALYKPIARFSKQGFNNKKSMLSGKQPVEAISLNTVVQRLQDWLPLTW